jgi:O-acetyl-ADP-ribose deacetylase
MRRTPVCSVEGVSTEPSTARQGRASSRNAGDSRAVKPAKITGAGRLPARHIIHAVGPVWHGGHGGEPELLASCYRRAIELAAAHGCRRVAFPAISTGVYAFPLADAARVALSATRAALRAHPNVEEARFWLFDESAHAAFSAILEPLEPKR